MMELVEEEEDEQPEPEVATPSRPLSHRRQMLRYQSLRNHVHHAECLVDGEEADKEDNIWRNFVSQCAATFLAVFAVIPSRNLQSSIHFSGQLGKISLVCMYGAYVVGCLLTPTILRVTKAKSLLLASLFFHIVYSVSNVIPSGYTLLPASCLVGVCQPAFWAVQDGLLLHYGIRYSAASHMAPHKALRLFQMATIITIHSAQILGNLLSSGLISASAFHCSEGWGVASSGTSSSSILNSALSNQSSGSQSTFNPRSQAAAVGRQPDRAFQKDKWTYTLPFIPIQTRRFSDPSPPVNFYQLLTLIYLCLSVVAMGSVLIFFESPDTSLANQRRACAASWRERALEVRKAVTNPRWLLGWFSAAYVGYAQGIIMCDITKIYGTDVLGCFIVGYMMVSFGTGNLIAVLAVEKLRPASTHPLSLSAGFLLNVCVLVLTSLWKPEVQQASALLLYTAFWGVADGTLQAQSQAMATRYASDEKDTAMTIFRVCQGLGLIASFLVSIFTRDLMSSLYVAFTLHVIGFLGLMLIAHDLANADRRPGHEDQCRDDENTCYSHDGAADEVERSDSNNHSTEAVFDVVDGEAAVDV
ncbi:unc-93-like protein a [Plakobranchus ocellatus]|uniref:Unc-93-like protein a n=1 Tax=Plakobranchus ocellatus TaxID=259542 RepID=A0AAV3ZK38_9GAST|nr:unc-93-like protein a [Plakobranchus ocellatus]